MQRDTAFLKKHYYGDNMNLSKKLLTLLAIFCVIASASAVCAADEGGWAGSQYQDEGGYAGSQYQDDGGWAGSQYNETLENAAGEPVSGCGDGVKEPATGETVKAASSHEMYSTGNPILALLAVGAVLGGAGVISRRK